MRTTLHSSYVSAGSLAPNSKKTNSRARSRHVSANPPSFENEFYICSGERAGFLTHLPLTMPGSAESRDPRLWQVRAGFRFALRGRNSAPAFTLHYVSLSDDDSWPDHNIAFGQLSRNGELDRVKLAKVIGTIEAMESEALQSPFAEVQPSCFRIAAVAATSGDSSAQIGRSVLSHRGITCVRSLDTA